MEKEYKYISFFNRTKKGLMFYSITTLGLGLGIVINSDRRGLTILWVLYVVVTVFIISRFLYRNRYYIIGLKVNTAKKIEIKYLDFNKIKTIICDKDKIFVTGNLSVSDFEKDGQLGAKLLVDAGGKKINVMLSNKNFIDIYTDFFNILDFNIDKKIDVDLKKSIKYLDKSLSKKVINVINS